MNRSIQIESELERVDERLLVIAFELQPFQRTSRGFDDMMDQYDRRDRKAALEAERQALLARRHSLQEEAARLPKSLRPEH
jgi:hypothetical protein